MGKGCLYLCGTPIGNLEDISLRVLRILQEVDYIAAEDTRWTRKLLSRYDIKARVFSCFEHNEEKRVAFIAGLLAEGKKVALTTSAGMPAVSDPGAALVKALNKQGHNIWVVPGPSAATAALALSGLGGGEYFFTGFLPRRQKEKEEKLMELEGLTCPIIVFESPRRLLATLAAMIKIWGGRWGIVARELTKIHEEVITGDLYALKEQLLSRAKVQGEITLVIEGGGEETEEREDLARLDYAAELLQNCGYKDKEIVKHLQYILKCPRNRAYARVLWLKKNKGDRKDPP